MRSAVRVVRAIGCRYRLALGPPRQGRSQIRTARSHGHRHDRGDDCRRGRDPAEPQSRHARQHPIVGHHRQDHRIGRDGVERDAKPLGNRLEVRDEFRRRLIALLRILRHHPRQHRREFIRNRGIQFPRIERVDVLMGVQLLGRSAFGHGRPAGECMVERAAERVDVAAHVGFARVERLLRRNVIEGAEGDARLRDAAVDRLRFEMPRQAHVHDFGPAIRRDENVRRLDVAMDHTALRGMSQTRRDLDHEPHAIPGSDRPAPVDRLPQRDPFHELERDEVQPLIFAAEVDAGHVVVVELGGGAGFLLEPRHAFEIERGFGGQDFEGDDAAEVEVAGLEYGRHAARADCLDQFEVPEAAARDGMRIAHHVRRGWRRRDVQFTGLRDDRRGVVRTRGQRNVRHHFRGIGAARRARMAPQHIRQGRVHLPRRTRRVGAFRRRGAIDRVGGRVLHSIRTRGAVAGGPFRFPQQCTKAARKKSAANAKIE